MMMRSENGPAGLVPFAARPFPRRGYSAGLAALAAMIGVGLVPATATAEKGSDKPFTVARFPVQAAAANAVAAKERAIADGQSAAFRSLLKRLVPVTAYGRLKSLKDTPTAGLSDGFSVRSERNSRTEYIASLDFSFRADAVRTLLRGQGVPYIDEQAPEVVLIAAVRDAGQLERGGGNADSWLGIWRDLDLANTLTPLRLEAIKPIIHNDTLNMLVGGDDTAVRVLASEYNGENIVAAIADVDRPAGRLHVTLAGRDAVGTFNLKRSYRLFDGDVGYAMELAAVISLGIVEGRWKSIKARTYGGVEAMAAPGEEVRMQVEFRSFSEWNAIRGRLEETPGVAGLRIDAVSARGADIALNFPGGGSPLANVLASQGLTLNSIGGNWFLRSSF
ncbi:MAG: DUF2066 domain-containing protein [Hyphomicrobiaceae bacterium]|nr:DUF2066 domain-containing protein [Hyphomicrobiaceae bacterium]